MLCINTVCGNLWRRKYAKNTSDKYLKVYLYIYKYLMENTLIQTYIPYIEVNLYIRSCYGFNFISLFLDVKNLNVLKPFLCLNQLFIEFCS